MQRQKKVIIEEVASTNIVETQDDIIDRTMMINEQLKISMTRTKNPTSEETFSTRTKIKYNRTKFRLFNKFKM